MHHEEDVWPTTFASPNRRKANSLTGDEGLTLEAIARRFAVESTFDILSPNFEAFDLDGLALLWDEPDASSPVTKPAPSPNDGVQKRCHSATQVKLMEEKEIPQSPPKKKRNKRKTDSKKPKLCTAPGCFTRDKGGGKCARHGGGYPCKSTGCKRIVAGATFCSNHGGTRKKKCSFEGCTKGDQGGGFCAAHGGGRKCIEKGCNRRDLGRGRCWSHGGGRRCSFETCKRSPVVNGFCRMHFES